MTAALVVLSVLGFVACLALGSLALITNRIYRELVAERERHTLIEVQALGDDLHVGRRVSRELSEYRLRHQSGF